MLSRLRRRALLLDRYWTALRRGGRSSVKPDNLDSDIADLAVRLSTVMEQLAIHAAFRADLRQRIDARATEQFVRESRAWSGPAIDPAHRRPTDNRTEPDLEERVIMSDTTHAHPEPMPIHQRRWVREALKLVAAAIIFTLVGAILVLALRDNDQNHSIVPGAGTPITGTPSTQASPTMTPSPTANVTATAHAARAALTATAASASTATATVLTPTGPTPGEVVATIPVGTHPFDPMAAAAGSLWVANGDDGTVSRIDPATNQVVATIQIGPSGNSPDGVVALGDEVWVSNAAEASLVRIDPATNQVVATINLPDVTPGSTRGIAAGAGSLWVSDPDRRRVIRVDPVAQTVVASIQFAGAFGLVATDDAVWVSDYYSTRKTVARIDPATNDVVAEVEIGTGLGPAQIAIGFDSVWVACQDSSSVVRIDPSTNAVTATITDFILNGDSVTPRAHAIAVDEHGVWLGDALNGGLFLIDPSTNQVSASLPTAPINAIAMTDGSIWMAQYQDDQVLRLNPAP